MQRFAALYRQLDASTATGDKVAALREYFAAAPAADAAWATYFLAGGKPRQVVPTALMRALACRLAGIEPWLFEECYQAVGDLAETIALVVPAAGISAGAGGAGGADTGWPQGQGPVPEEGSGLGFWIEQRLLPLRGLAPQEQAARLAQAFAELDAAGRFLLVKLIGGGFRVGVSKLLVQRALAEVAGVDAKLVAERMMGYAEARATPSAERFAALIAPDGRRHAGEPGQPGQPGELGARVAPNATPGLYAPHAPHASHAPAAPAAPTGQPYPFFLAHALGGDVGSLGPPAAWQIEWKYDGIRAQLVRRGGACFVWSRGEELVTERFPEVVHEARALPEGTVLDGELLVWREGETAPATFQRLQQRLGRKTLGKRLLAEAPVVFVAYDLLERDGADLRGAPLAERRAALEALQHRQAAAGVAALRIVPVHQAADWPAVAALRAAARGQGVEGLMLKERTSRYGSGRTKGQGLWWKWKVDPLTVDAVLVYAQAGHGRRAGVYTDYTFAVWSRPPRDAAEAAGVVQAIARGEPAPPRDGGALQLLPFAKAYSGLSDEEFKAVDREIRARTITKFGPVRSVEPTLVFEIGFEGIQPSPRHKSGVAVRFPRMLRIRHDKPLHEADAVQALHALMAAAA